MESSTNNYEKLKDSLDAYIQGRITYAELKHTTAPFGIYRQRDNKFMVRIRVPGGEVSLSHLKNIVNITEKYSAEFIHLTTRQDIQLHGIKPQNITPIISDCHANGMIFKGGGGDTFRNIAACPDSGLSVKSIFDVIPHAKYLTEYLYSYEKAFSLPRKLKIAFSCNSDDKALAKFQDLGFIACLKNGEKGFKVYVAGGMGRNSAKGIKVFDFIPEKQFVNCAVALTNLFYDHGNRENRSKARLRYLAKELGKDKFINLFLKYLDETKDIQLSIPDLKSNFELRSLKDRPRPSITRAYSKRYHRIKIHLREGRASSLPRCRPSRMTTNAPAYCMRNNTICGSTRLALQQWISAKCLFRNTQTNLSAFSEWEQYAVQNTIFENIVLTKLFVPYGKLSPADAKKIIDIASRFGTPFLRLTRDQNLSIPLKRSSVPALFKMLCEFTDEIDFAARSMKGLITSCIGAKVCEIGLIDTQPFTDAITLELDNYFRQNKKEKSQLLPKIISSLKVSGCPNSCSNHPAAKLGLQGIRKKDKNGNIVEYCKILQKTNAIKDNEICTLNSNDIGTFIKDKLLLK